MTADPLALYAERHTVVKRLPKKGDPYLNDGRIYIAGYDYFAAEQWCIVEVPT